MIIRKDKNNDLQLVNYFRIQPSLKDNYTFPDHIASKMLYDLTEK